MAAWSLDRWWRMGCVISLGVTLSGCFLISTEDLNSQQSSVTPLPDAFQMRVYMASGSTATPVFTFRAQQAADAYDMVEENAKGPTPLQGRLRFTDTGGGRLAFSFGSGQSYILGLSRVQGNILTLHATVPQQGILPRIQSEQGLLRTVRADAKGNWMFPSAASWREFSEVLASGRLKPEPREDVAFVARPGERLPDKLVKVGGAWRPEVGPVAEQSQPPQPPAPQMPPPQQQPPTPPPPPSSRSEWRMSEKRDAFSDRIVSQAWLEAKETAGGRGAARLYLVCGLGRPMEADVRVDFGVRLDTRLIGERRKLSVTDIRFDRRPAQIYGWGIIDTHTQLVSFTPLESSLAKINVWPRSDVNLDWSVYSFMQDLLRTHELIVRTSAADGSTLFARFEIGDAGPVIERIQRGCPR